MTSTRKYESSASQAENAGSIPVIGSTKKPHLTSDFTLRNHPHSHGTVAKTVAKGSASPHTLVALQRELMHLTETPVSLTWNHRRTDGGWILRWHEGPTESAMARLLSGRRLPPIGLARTTDTPEVQS